MADIIKYNSRITLKYDTLTNWNAVKDTFTPLKGEVCIVNPSEDLGSGTKEVLIKIGDGENKFAALPYLSAKAADVYAWAKAANAEYNPDNSHIEFKTGDTLFGFVDLSDITSSIANIETKISNAMHFLGVTTTPLTDGSSNKTLTGIANEITAGAVVLAPYGEATAERYEFVWTGSAWEMLGQEGSFAIKGSIVDADVADTAAILQTKIATTLGKSTLAGDIADIDNRIKAIVQKNNEQDSDIASHKSYATIQGNTGNTTASTVNDTLEIVGTGKISVAVSADKATISHAGITKNDTTSTDTVKLTPSINSDTFTAIDSITYDNTGHVSAINTKTVTVDVSDINSEIASHKSFSIVKAGSTNLEAEGKNDTLNVSGGTSITVSGDASTDTMTITHSNVTRTDPTKTTLTPAHKGEFTIVESVSSNSQGHVTAVQQRTIKLPSVDDLESNFAALNNTAWKTTTATTIAQASSGLTNQSNIANLAKSDLTINKKSIGYIVWDCGSASVNV